MKQKLIITIGILGVLVGLAFIMPAIAQLRTTGSLSALEVPLLLLGIALSVGGISAACYAIKRGKA